MSSKSIPDQCPPLAFRRLVHKSTAVSFSALGVLCLGSFFAAAAQPQVPPAVTTRQAGKLELQNPVEREIGPGQVDVFTVDAAGGQFLRIVAEQKGVDVVVRIVAPDGKVLVIADRSNYSFGPESASAIAPLPGSIQIQVEKHPLIAETGRYAVELTDLRDPTVRTPGAALLPAEG